MRFARPTFVLTALILFILSIPVTSPAQVRPVYDQGAIGLGQLLKRLNNTKSVMHIGAHPDDEDSDLIAYLARGENARTVYLSLTRGDGGQNVIGPELFESLGIIRSEELLQARTLDGATQMFTRAFDYGYSKRLEEAQAKWDIEEVKCDVVRAIRTFRPLVVIPRFTGTPFDGHGQHQFAGFIAPIAIEAAADPRECPGTGDAWRVMKLYVSQSFRDRSEPGLNLNTGKYDPLIGRSYFEIAAAGRSQHKTQEQGGLELKGDRFAGMNLQSDVVGSPAKEASPFDGLDTSISGIQRLIGTSEARLEEELGKLDLLLRKALEGFDPLRPSGIAGTLVEAYEQADKVYWSTRQPEAKFLMDLKRDELRKAIALAAGIRVDFLAEAETVTSGDKFIASVKVFAAEPGMAKVTKTEVRAPDGWTVGTAAEARDDSQFARFFRETADHTDVYSLSVPGRAQNTQPYFMVSPRDGYLYRWPDDSPKNVPFSGAEVNAVVTMEIGGKTVEFTQPLEYRYADPTRGELRRNVNVVPKLSVDLDQHLIAVPMSDLPVKRKISINLVSNAGEAVSGKARIAAPAGWTVSPAEAAFAVSNKGEGASFEFEVTIPKGASPDAYSLKAVAQTSNLSFSKTMNTIAYDHIQTHRFYTDSEASVAVMDLKAAGVRVGYVPGSGDYAPDAMRQMGLEVETIGKKELTSGDLSIYDTIVIGIRASETNPDFVANNGRLLDYVRAGGTMIVQYQKVALIQQNLVPFPASMASRVAEEDAKITILEPAHPVFNFPNKITQTDFEGWVQERNLYSFSSFDERYTPLLEAHDTGEPENKGGMVYAKIGEGQYVYTSYAFFRQLPAGVPGAWRLWANLVSLGE